MITVSTNDAANETQQPSLEFQIEQAVQYIRDTPSYSSLTGVEDSIALMYEIRQAFVDGKISEKDGFELADSLAKALKNARKALLAAK
jgi:hypothetical protein